jgi:PPOX class probable F420-dependent enzyme
MASLKDPAVRALLDKPNCAVISTINEDGSILSTVVWVSADDDTIAVNSAIGRRWPANLQRDPHTTVLVYDGGNPYDYVEIRGTATAAGDGADEHIDSLTKKYMDQDKYPFRAPGEERIKFVIEPEHVRHQKQG